MAFLNRKEQVLDIQLTQYGKHLLSKGKWKPAYYSFHDNEVLYDNEYAGVTEIQNSASIRILESVQNDSFYVFHGIESEIKRANKLIRDGKESEDILQPTSEKHYSLYESLGNSSLGVEAAPAFHIVALKNEFTGSLYYSTGSHQKIKIPQLESKIEYKVTVGKTNPPEQSQTPADELNPIALGDVQDKVFEDGTFIDIEEDSIVLEITEKNVSFLRENFDIEVYKIENASNTKISGSISENLIPLYFKTYPKRNEILLEEKELKELIENPTAINVEYYLELEIDDAIGSAELCSLRNDKKVKSYLIDSPPKKCDTSTNKLSRDIYIDPDTDVEGCK